MSCLRESSEPGVWWPQRGVERQEDDSQQETDGAGKGCKAMRTKNSTAAWPGGVCEDPDPLVDLVLGR